MALSVVDLYSKILPKTNCKDCGFPTCIAFAGMVVSEKHPLKNCPHIEPALLEKAQKELEEQYKQGKWLKKDMAQEALEWARQKAASTKPGDIASRIGAEFHDDSENGKILIPYFNKQIIVRQGRITDEAGNELTRNEQTFIYIHMARGGVEKPTGNMKSLKEFPNTVSKIVSMNDHVEGPLKQAFTSKLDKLVLACESAGGQNVKDQYDSSDIAYCFTVFPKVPVILLFWDQGDGFEADVKLLFDETIILHLDIEAIMFLSEHLTKMLIDYSNS